MRCYVVLASSSPVNEVCVVLRSLSAVNEVHVVLTSWSPVNEVLCRAHVVECSE